MKVAILYSGGKDSTFAIDYALQQGWDIRYLISVKPTRTDCYLFHYATVELTPLLAGSLGIRHHLLSCSVADPRLEAAIVEKTVLAEEKVDAILLGGIGLQETQLRTFQQLFLPRGIEVFATHAGEDHAVLMEQMLEKGYKFLITQFASDGLKRWLGKFITKDNFAQLKKDAQKYGFHIGAEGGYYDTLVVDGPIFKHTLELLKTENVFESEYAGHVKVLKPALTEKAVAKLY
ncbi:diphthine--ammonia ligase [Candidatus Woesearchaeota archaeon]|nr:diphthine--ammonia ligase [Candidatus Woesearchaeota archaeon]